MEKRGFVHSRGHEECDSLRRRCGGSTYWLAAQQGPELKDHTLCIPLSVTAYAQAEGKVSNMVRRRGVRNRPDFIQCLPKDVLVALLPAFQAGSRRRLQA